MEARFRIRLTMKNSISKKQLREFSLLIGFAFPIIIGWILPALAAHNFRTWTLLIGIPILIIGLIKPSLLFYPYKVWMQIGSILGWFNSRLILGFIFYFVLLPISFMMKIFGYDPLRLKKNNQKSYREFTQEKKIDLTRIF